MRNKVSIFAETEELTGDDGWLLRVGTGWVSLVCTCGTVIRGQRDEVLPVIRAHYNKETAE